MSLRVPFLCGLLLAFCLPSSGRADDFAIDLKAEANKNAEKAEAKYPVPTVSRRRASF